MAGHSKFKNIMHRKGAQDRKKAQVFAKLGKEITVAAKMGGGGDPSTNARLRLAIQNARGERMPKENIERALQKGVGGNEGADFIEFHYEGYGPAGVALIVEVMTDNRNRTAADVRSIFNKNGGALGESGSVAFMFDRVGEIIYSEEVATNDVIFEAALEAGANDVISSDEGHEITCAPEELASVANHLEAKLGAANHVRFSWRPQTLISVQDEKVETLFNLIESLEENDDVQNVYANYEISDEAMSKLEA